MSWRFRVQSCPVCSTKQLPTLHTRMVQPMGMSERRSQYARARSSAAFASSKHYRNYTQLRNEVLILPVKLKETLNVNYLFTWYFCWVLNVNLHVQITCRLTALHVAHFTNAHRRASQTNVCVPCLPNRLHQQATFFCPTASSERATCLPYHFPPEERKLVSSREIRYTHHGWTTDFCGTIQVCRMSHASGKKQHRQTNYPVTLRRVRVTNVAVEKH
jgi:hypothetical protein